MAARRQGAGRGQAAEPAADHRHLHPVSGLTAAVQGNCETGGPATRSSGPGPHPPAAPDAPAAVAPDIVAEAVRLGGKAEQSEVELAVAVQILVADDRVPARRKSVEHECPPRQPSAAGRAGTAARASRSACTAAILTALARLDALDHRPNVAAGAAPGRTASRASAGGRSHAALLPSICGQAASGPARNRVDAEILAAAAGPKSGHFRRCGQAAAGWVPPPVSKCRGQAVVRPEVRASGRYRGTG